MVEQFIRGNFLLIIDHIKSYFEAGIKIIPVAEKIPCIADYYRLPWENIKSFDDLDREYSSRVDRSGIDWKKKVTGFAVLLGKVNNGLCVVDVDSDDKELILKVINHLPSQVNRIGKKGCAFFGLTDGDERATSRKRFPIKGTLKDAVEIFWSSAVITCPPSLHSENHHYFWVADSDSEYVSLIDAWKNQSIPIFSTEQLLSIDTLIGSATVSIANASLPKSSKFELHRNVEGLGEGRTSIMYKVWSQYVSSRDYNISLSSAFSELSSYDTANWPANRFFETANRRVSRSGDLNKDYKANVEYFIKSMSRSVERKRKDQGLHFSLELDSLDGFIVPNIDSTFIINDWGEIAHYDTDSRMPDMPEEYVPETIFHAVKTLADTNGVKVGPLYATLLFQMGACLQNSVKIYAQKTKSRFYRTNVAVVLVGPSASKKTFVMKTGTAQISKLADKLNDKRDRDYIEQEKEIQYKIESLHKNKKRLIDQMKDDEVDSINIAIKEAQDKLDKIFLPYQNFILESATVQACIKAQCASTRGVVFTFDELSLFFESMRKKGNEELRQFVMKGLGEMGDYKYDTQSKGVERIRDHYLSMIAGVQSDVLAYHFDKLYAFKETNDGLLARFVMIPMNTPAIATRNGAGWESFPAIEQIFTNAWHQGPVESTISEEAEPFVDQYLDSIAKKAKMYDNDPKASFIGKNQSRIFQYACIEQYFLTQNVSKLSLRAFELAADFLNYSDDCLLGLFKRNKGELIDSCEQIVDLMRDRILIDGTTNHHWHQTFRQKNRQVDITKFNLAMRDLESRGFIRITKGKKNNQSTIYINPKFYQE